MLPLTEDEEELSEAYSLCTGILFTGGHDVSPDVYGEKAKSTCGKPCNDILYSGIDKPFLGICRGLQFINAYLGGSLYQDLPTEYNCRVEHHMSPPYNRPAHKVQVLEGTRLAKIIGSGLHEVNSYHHQAIRDIAQTAEVMAVSEDGLIEAISVPGQRFAVGVQWHPELIYTKDEKSKKLIQAFIGAC